MVIGGVIGETFAEWTEEHARRYRTLAKLSAVVLIMGLAVELSAHRIVIELSAEETAESDRQLGQTFKAAGAAIGRASEADERAETVEGHNKQLGIDLEAEKTKSATAQRLLAERLTGALQQAADASRKADEEIQARLKIEQELAWRTVSDAQAKTLRDLMPPEYIGVRLTMSNIVGDAEGAEYATELAKALQEAGWVVTALNTDLLTGILPEGVRVRVRRQDNRSAGTLQHILKLAGIEAQGELDPKLGDEGIGLFVGLKPRTGITRKKQ